MTNNILEKAKIGLQDLMLIPHSSHTASCKDIAVCAAVSKAHIAGLVDEFLEIDDIHRMNWLLRTEDHIRIDHDRDVLGKANASSKPSPRAIKGLKTKLLNN
ncbi:hypothetical protein TNCV_4420761 [Trichonephila clavipes]|nr:hypothetical protein TNCV_4420761 [Trichonephila clavipes]